MKASLSLLLREDLTTTVRRALRDQGVVNVSKIAEQVRRRNEAENVALEDLEGFILRFAHSLSAAMEFDSVVNFGGAGNGAWLE
jgi:hypothetical protein